MELISSLKISAKLDNLDQIISFVSEHANSQGFDNEKIGKIQLATEEIAVNIFDYAYPDSEGEIEIKIMADETNFMIKIIDSGNPFNINDAPSPSSITDVSDQKIGGWGIFLTKTIVDSMDYKYENGKNIVDLVLAK